MKRLLIATALLTAASSMSARAGTYTADFSTTALDPTLHVYDTGTQLSENTGGGYLTVTQSATATPIASQLLIGTNFAITGDFSESVLVDFSGVTNGNNITTLGSISDNFGTGGSNLSPVAAYLQNGSPSVNGSFYLDGSSTSFQSSSATSPATIGISRVGDTINEYVNGALLNSATDAAYLQATTFNIGLNNYDASGDAKSITFSNFTITTPSLISAAPEPSAWILMIAGTGLAGIALRRRQRNAGILSYDRVPIPII